MKRKRVITFLIALTIYLAVSTVGFQNLIVYAQGEGKNTNQALADAQLEKVKLEIQELKNNDSFAGRFPQYIPLITTLIAVAGFCFTIYQFFEAQNKDRLAKEETQNKDRLAKQQEQKLRDEDLIRTNVEKLLSVHPEKEESVGRVSFLLKDLSTLVERNPSEMQKVSDSLIEFIRNDCNFDNLRHIRIDIAALQHWPAYKKYLLDDAVAHTFITYKYFQAFRHVHDEDASYFESIQYEDGHGFRVTRYTEESRYLRFVSLIEGFESHLELMEKDTIKGDIKRFQEALNNPILTKQLIDSKRFPKF